MDTALAPSRMFHWLAIILQHWSHDKDLVHATQAGIVSFIHTITNIQAVHSQYIQKECAVLHNPGHGTNVIGWGVLVGYLLLNERKIGAWSGT